MAEVRFASKLQNETVDFVLDRIGEVGGTPLVNSFAQAISEVTVGSYFILLAGTADNPTSSDIRYQRTSTAPGYTLTADQPVSKNALAAPSGADLIGTSDGGDLELVAQAVSVGLFTSISGKRFPPSTTSIVTTGHTVAGVGCAQYTRRTTTPSANEQAAGLGFWLTQDASGRWWGLSDPQPNASMYGSMFDATISYSGGIQTVNGTDDTASNQAAVNHALYFSNRIKEVQFPAGLSKTSDTLHIGYGDKFQSIIIRGQARYTYDNNSATATGIACTATDRPAINFQGLRRPKMIDVCVVGANLRWLRENYNSITDRTNLVNWRGPQSPGTGGTSIERYRPYCGIAVDAFTGPAPASPYPAVNYPAWTGISSQYNRGASSQIEFNGVSVQGFTVAWAVQPGNVPAASNGDFIRWIECDSSYNETAFAICHSDARVITFDRTLVHFGYVGWDSVTYGVQTGNFAALLENCSFDNVYKAFNVNLGITTQMFAPSVIINNPYCEATYSIGTFRTSTATGRPGKVIINGGEINFLLKSGEFSPTYMIDGLGQVSLRIDGTSFGNPNGGILTANCDVEYAEYTFNAAGFSAFDLTIAGGRRASSFICGLWSPKCADANIIPYAYHDYQGNTLSGDRQKAIGWDPTISGRITASASGGRGAPIPWWVKSIGYLGNFQPITEPPRQTINRATYNLTASTITGRTWAFTMPLDGLAYPSDPSMCLGAGDIIRDDTTGIIAYVRTVSFSGSGAGQTATVSADFINGIYLPSSGSPITTINNPSLNSGTITLFCARRGMIGLTKRLLMTTTTTGVFTLTQVGTETLPANEMGASNVWPINVNDYLLGGFFAASPEESVFPGPAKVTAVASTGGAATGSVTVNVNARRAVTVTAPLTIRV